MNHTRTKGRLLEYSLAMILVACMGLALAWQHACPPDRAASLEGEEVSRTGDDSMPILILDGNETGCMNVPDGPLLCQLTGQEAYREGKRCQEVCVRLTNTSEERVLIQAHNFPHHLTFWIRDQEGQTVGEFTYAALYSHGIPFDAYKIPKCRFILALSCREHDDTTHSLQTIQSCSHGPARPGRYRLGATAFITTMDEKGTVVQNFQTHSNELHLEVVPGVPGERLLPWRLLPAEK